MPRGRASSRDPPRLPPVAGASRWSCAHHQLHVATTYDSVMAGESELVIVAEGDTPDGARWQVRAGGTADEYLHAWKVISADGEWDGSGSAARRCRRMAA
jgi:hypothetical protein